MSWSEKDDRIRDLDSSGWVCDGRRLVTETAFRPEFDLHRGFADTLTFYQDSGWL